MKIPLERLVLATKNADKRIEVAEIVKKSGLADHFVDDLEWDDVEETEPTLVGNALLKARAVADATRHPALADDTGLEVGALGGLPGVRTGRFAGEDATYDDNVKLLLAEMEEVTDRRARFVTVVALVHPEGWEETAEGELVGSIATEPRGEGGFGYDPVFEVDGRTLSEIGETEKNSLSHRARAISNLVTRLQT